MSFPEIPEGWEVIGRRRSGPFVTHLTFRRSDGTEVHWNSRRHRKRARHEGETAWWAPRAISWWIATCFAVGSALFAIGACPGYAQAVGVFVDGLTFFAGSIFFTTAGFLQYLEAANAPLQADHEHRDRRWRVFTFEPRRVDWWATVVQFAGTLLFNRNTFNAMRTGLDTQAINQEVWRPDAVGSACFLIASLLAYLEVTDRWFGWRVRSYSWWIGFLNLVGSFFFAVSAIASYVVPDSGQMRNAEWVNIGTFVGALCFLVGAVLLLPESTHDEPDTTRE